MKIDLIISLLVTAGIVIFIVYAFMKPPTISYDNYVTPDGRRCVIFSSRAGIDAECEL